MAYFAEPGGKEGLVLIRLRVARQDETAPVGGG